MDGDGDLDLIVNNENSPAFVYRNNENSLEKNNYVALKLIGKSSNPFAIGAKIKLYKNGQIFNRELFPVRGFQASVDYKQIIGVGKSNSIDSMIIIWPDRSFTKIEKPALNKLQLIQQPKQKGEVYNFTTNIQPWFKPIAGKLEKHNEDPYVDFFSERNLPEMLSREGPKIARGDVNNDGLEDVYIGGAKDYPGQLYLQSNSGSFIKKEEPVFKIYQSFEDIAVLFFDADKDGDLDLFIGAGGNNVHPGEREIQHRLYINDGKGNFTINEKAFPINDANISVVAADDFDNDGDEDLFVGGRSVPFGYGSMPRSYIYENDGKGNFTDVTEKVNTKIGHIGMVTGALWADVSGDKQKELIITGEWMTTKIFAFSKGKFDELKNTGLEKLNGWWQSIACADVNNDGKQDLIIGNIGENFYLRPTQSKPVKLWVADFDHNGTTEQFLTQTINGKDMPVFLKRDVTEQFPFLKKENLKHSVYAKKSVNDLFDKTIISAALVNRFDYCSSIVAINDGHGHFSVKPLPARVQLSSVNAICVSDINNDGKPDLLLGGNMFTFPPQFGRLDASYGLAQLNDGKGSFYEMNNTLSGINLKGEVKDIKEIKTKKGKAYLFTQNNDYPVMYQLERP